MTDLSCGAATGERHAVTAAPAGWAEIRRHAVGVGRRAAGIGAGVDGDRLTTARQGRGHVTQFKEVRPPPVVPVNGSRRTPDQCATGRNV